MGKYEGRYESRGVIVLESRASEAMVWWWVIGEIRGNTKW